MRKRHRAALAHPRSAGLSSSAMVASGCAREIDHLGPLSRCCYLRRFRRSIGRNLSIRFENLLRVGIHHSRQGRGICRDWSEKWTRLFVAQSRGIPLTALLLSPRRRVRTTPSWGFSSEKVPASLESRLVAETAKLLASGLALLLVAAFAAFFYLCCLPLFECVRRIARQRFSARASSCAPTDPWRAPRRWSATACWSADRIRRI